MTEKAVTSVAVPDVEAMAQNLALVRSSGKLKGDDGLLERLVGILVEQPHGLGRIDGRAAADAHDPVGLELLHGLRAAHHRVDGRVGLDALEDLDLEARFLKIRLDVLQEAAAAHGAARR